MNSIEHTVLVGPTLPVEIPAFYFNISIKDLLSTKSYLLIVVEAKDGVLGGVHRWKPGLGGWEKIESNSKIYDIAPDYQNDELYAVKFDGGGKIIHCLLKPQIECSEFGSDTQGAIADILLDGERLYIVKDKDNAVYWMRSDEIPQKPIHRRNLSND